MMMISDILKKLKILKSFQMQSSQVEILSEKSFGRILERERERAMRNDHHYSLLLLDLSSFIENEEMVNFLIRIIADRIRAVDEFGWHDDKRIGVMLPYTSEKGADSVANYICQEFESRIQNLGCEVYTYDIKDEMGENFQTQSHKRGSEK